MCVYECLIVCVRTAGGINCVKYCGKCKRWEAGSVRIFLHIVVNRSWDRKQSDISNAVVFRIKDGP